MPGVLLAEQPCQEVNSRPNDENRFWNPVCHSSKPRQLLFVNQMAFASLFRELRPLLVCPEKLTRCGQPQETQVEKPNLSSPENLPSGGGPEILDHGPAGLACKAGLKPRLS